MYWYTLRLKKAQCRKLSLYSLFDHLFSWQYESTVIFHHYTYHYVSHNSAETNTRISTLFSINVAQNGAKKVMLDQQAHIEWTQQQPDRHSAAQSYRAVPPPLEPPARLIHQWDSPCSCRRCGSPSRVCRCASSPAGGPRSWWPWWPGPGACSSPPGSPGGEVGPGQVRSGGVRQGHLSSTSDLDKSQTG